jgi:hypothetical protein
MQGSLPLHHTQPATLFAVSLVGVPVCRVDDDEAGLRNSASRQYVAARGQ